MKDLLDRLHVLFQSQQLRSILFDPSSVLATALSTCANSIETISSEVQALESNGLARAWEKIKWPFSEMEMQKSLATLRRCAATFQFALTIEGW